MIDPDDEYCFDRLLAIRPASFQLVFPGNNVRLFRVHPS